jgi:hypothetical protein
VLFFAEEVFNTAAGFQCIAALTVHLAAIQTVVVTHDPAHLAVGDESGMVSLGPFCVHHNEREIFARNPVLCCIESAQRCLSGYIVQFDRRTAATQLPITLR